jgi:hypothetical protein
MSSVERRENKPVGGPLIAVPSSAQCRRGVRDYAGTRRCRPAPGGQILEWRHPRAGTAATALRHTPSPQRDGDLRKVLPWLAADHPKIFNAWQSTQNVRVETSRPIDPVFRTDSVVLAISVEKDGNLRVVYARIGRCQGRPAWRGAQAAVARPYPAVTCHVGVNGGPLCLRATSGRPPLHVTRSAGRARSREGLCGSFEGGTDLTAGR